MRISVTRTGGYAGLTEELGAADTSQLDAAARQTLEQAVRAMNFFELPARLPGEPVGADFLTYVVTVQDGQREHNVTFTGEEATAAPLRDLIATVTRAQS
jgi:hypothetical protein